MEYDKRRGVVRVSPLFLADSLRIPQEAEIIGVEWDFVHHDIVLHVTDPSFKLLSDHVAAPEVQLIYTKVPTKDSPSSFAVTGRWG